MHDRRLDGETYIFGNAGGLYMRAMTWWDHTTRSIWSQPWGRAIEGPLAGRELKLLPSQVTTWASWKRDHPNTLVMLTDMDSLHLFRQGFSPDFVIGVVVAEGARAYRFMDVLEQGVINDHLAGHPLLVWGSADDFRTYSRWAQGRTLTFKVDGDSLVDLETGSRWNPHQGFAFSGELSGANLEPLPSMTSFDWAWLDFYPKSEIFDPDKR